jgi:protein-tyrosine phosphatase
MSNQNFSAMEIIPGLWIGDMDDAASYFFIKEKKIDIIINCTTDISFIVGELNLEKKRLSVEDSYADNEKLYKNMEYLVDYIYNALNKNKNILVHSKFGKQRAPTIVAGYFIKYGKVDMHQAIKYIRMKVPTAFVPSVNFEYALNQFSKTMQKNSS